MRSLSSVIKSYQYDVQFLALQTDESLPGTLPGAAKKETQRKDTIESAVAKARQILDSAQEYKIRTGRESVEKSRKEYEKARQSGYSDGFSQGMSEGMKSGRENGEKKGFEEGIEKAEAENRKTLNELTKMIENVEKSKKDVLRQFEDGIEELAFTMAKAILKRELSIDENALRSIILSATESYRNQAWVRIRVSERDAGTLMKADSGIAEALKKVSDSVKVIPVPEMDDGSCVIEMPDQVIDAGIDTQLRKMEEAVESSGQDKAG